MTSFASALTSVTPLWQGQAYFESTIRQANALHERGISAANAFHREEQALEQALHRRASAVDKELHYNEMLHIIEVARREAVRANSNAPGPSV